jgi:head-tail adaptor
MDASELRDRVRIEQQGTTEDAVYGPQPGAWTELDTVPARVQEGLPGRAESGDSVRVASRPAKVRIRYREDVNTRMRMVLLDRGNRIVKIVAGPAEARDAAPRQFVDFSVEEFTTSGDAA